MKKLFNYLIATALMAFTFTSCEDVPSPFGDIVKPDSGGEEVVIEPSGDGTEANPYNVAGVLEFISGLGADTPSTKDVYVKGIITEITEKFGTQYGNATFIMSDTESGANKFTFYRGLYIGNVKYSKDTDTNIKEGDVVVICGKVVNYKGNTPETSQGGAYVVSINGQGGGTTPPTPTETLGTKDDPITVTKALEYINALADNASTAQDAYVAGKITKIKTTDANVQQYHNIDYIISDGTNELTVFRGKNLDNTDFNSASDIAVGDEVVVFGKLTKYVNGGNTTPEVAQGNYIVKITKGSGGGGGDTPTPGGTGDGSENSPFSVLAAIAKAEQAGVFVKAYIVGWVEGQVYASGAHFDGNSSSATNILIAESASETDPAKCMPVQLPAGAIRTGLNLMDNPGNYKKEVLLYGDIIKYFGVPGIKNTSYAKIGSTEIGTKPGGGGGDQPGGGTPSGTTTLTRDFKAEGQGDWTIVNVKALPTGLEYVWAYDNRYGMKASAFANSKRYETDSWLVSPALSLPTGGTMTFKQALNYATSEYVKIMYTTTNGTGDVNSAEWQEATVDTWPAGNNWTFVSSNATLPAGTVRVAFRYTSTTEKAATWEIESVSIK